MNINATGNSLIGGFAGNNYNNALINSCYNSGKINCNSKGNTLWMAGFCGNNQITSTIEYSYNIGELESNIENTDQIGIAGIAANNMTNSTIQFCYSTGDIISNSSENVAGIVRTNNASTVKNVYYKEGIANKAYVSNLNSGSITNSGERTIIVMCSADFITLIGDTYFRVDSFNENDGYPLLVWQYKDENNQ